MPRLCCLLMLVLISGLIGFSAHATLIEVDDPVFGPASITRDTDTGLEWLDVPISAGRSHDEVLLELGPGGDFEGFRYAALEEFFALIYSVGIHDVNQGAGPDSYAPAVYLQGLIGETEPTITTGVTDTLATDRYFAPTISRSDEAQVAGVEVHESNIGGGATGTFGHWLVRPIPEPGTGLLVIAGLVGLAGSRRGRE